MMRMSFCMMHRAFVEHLPPAALAVCAAAAKTRTAPVPEDHQVALLGSQMRPDGQPILGLVDLHIATQLSYPFGELDDGPLIRLVFEHFARQLMAHPFELLTQFQIIFALFFMPTSGVFF